MNAALRPSRAPFPINTTRHNLDPTPAEDNLVPAQDFIRARSDEGSKTGVAGCRAQIVERLLSADNNHPDYRSGWLLSAPDRPHSA